MRTPSVDVQGSRTLGHYSAAKAAFSTYFAALRRERRRDGLAVIEAVAAVLHALREDRRQVAWDLKARDLVTA